MYREDALLSLLVSRVARGDASVVSTHRLVTYACASCVGSQRHYDIIGADYELSWVLYQVIQLQDPQRLALLAQAIGMEDRIGINKVGTAVVST